MARRRRMLTTDGRCFAFAWLTFLVGASILTMAAIDNRDLVPKPNQGRRQLVDVDVLPAGVGQPRGHLPFVKSMVGDL